MWILLVITRNRNEPYPVTHMAMEPVLKDITSEYGAIQPVVDMADRLQQTLRNYKTAHGRIYVSRSSFVETSRIRFEHPDSRTFLNHLRRWVDWVATTTRNNPGRSASYLGCIDQLANDLVLWESSHGEAIPDRFLEPSTLRRIVEDKREEVRPPQPAMTERVDADATATE